MRSPDELLRSALAVLDRAEGTAFGTMLPLFSGGHDSLCACHVASRHRRFRGSVNFIKTGIGAKANRAFVESACKEMSWELRVWESTDTYEKFVRNRGFPGPGMHKWVYIRIKERCVRQMTRGKGRVALVTGCRRDESTRRMGSVEPIKVGEAQTWKGRQVIENKNRVWVAPCFDWSAEEQAAYMEEHDLPKNPLKIALGMSGECFCGAFARPNEIELVRRWVPDVAEEIDRLAGIAADIGKPCVWGVRPPDEPKGLAVVGTGPLCTSCDRKAAAAGVVFAPIAEAV